MWYILADDNDSRNRTRAQNSDPRGKILCGHGPSVVDIMVQESEANTGSTSRFQRRKQDVVLTRVALCTLKIAKSAAERLSLCESQDTRKAKICSNSLVGSALSVILILIDTNARFASSHGDLPCSPNPLAQIGRAHV